MLWICSHYTLVPTGHEMMIAVFLQPSRQTTFLSSKIFIPLWNFFPSRHLGFFTPFSFNVILVSTSFTIFYRS